MNNDIFFGRNSIRFYYFRFKDSAYYSISVIVVTIVVCILLLLNFIMPQLDKWFSIRNEILATRLRIDTINDNIAYLNSLDRNALSSDVQITSLTLPPEKNFNAILDALTVASLRAGVSFQDFTFQVGKTTSTPAEIAASKMKGVSSVMVSVVINNTVDDTKNFIKELARIVPLSEVISVDGSSGAVTVTVAFYQKVLPKQSLKDDQPIPHVVESNATIINKLASWQIAPKEPPTESINSSSSAIPLF